MAVYLKQRNGQIDLTKKMFKGDDGGYYVPNVDADGNLTWAASEEDMPEVEGANIRGEQGERGDSGVYIGAEEPDGDVTVWINPEGDVSVELATKEYVDEAVAGAGGNVDLTGYATEEYVNTAILNIEIPNPDLSAYYTKTEIDDLLANIEPTEQLPASEEGAF